MWIVLQALIFGFVCLLFYKQGKRDANKLIFMQLDILMRTVENMEKKAQTGAEKRESE